MTILVTGGAGYIGSHMVWALCDANEDVVVIDNLSTGFARALPPQVKLYQGSIDDLSLMRTLHAAHGIEAIIHFAGSIIVPESVRDPLKYYDNNTSRSRALIGFAVEACIRHFVFSSTAAVYGTPDRPDPVLETAVLTPESPYGRSKLMTELMLHDVSPAYDFTYTALRYFNVAGADPQGRTGQSTAGATHLIKVACEVLVGKREDMNVFGSDYPTPDGTCVRDYIHVHDLVQAHLCALKRMRAGEGSLIANCGYGHGYSVLDVLKTASEVSGRIVKTHMAPRRDGDAAQIVANADLARSELGWKPAYDDLKFIIQSALDWERHLQKSNYADA